MKYIGQRYYIDADDLAYILPEAEVEVVDDTHVDLSLIHIYVYKRQMP